MRPQNDEIGKVKDLRREDGRPCQKWLLTQSGEWLKAHWQSVRARAECVRWPASSHRRVRLPMQAIDRQLKELVTAEGEVGTFQQALRDELKLVRAWEWMEMCARVLLVTCVTCIFCISFLSVIRCVLC